MDDGQDPAHFPSNRPTEATSGGRRHQRPRRTRLPEPLLPRAEAAGEEERTP